ncbi:MAG: DUF559 domain-containing protein [Candidatus Absconditabacteria bacterium]
MDTLGFIEYNRGNNERARKMRREMTIAESKMRFTILNSRPRGYKFIRQKRIKGFILDFYCSKLLLCIEIDGSSHNNKQEYDKQRTDILQKQGIITVRYTNQQVINTISEVFDDLLYIIKERENYLIRLPG